MAIHEIGLALDDESFKKLKEIKEKTKKTYNSVFPDIIESYWRTECQSQ